MKVSRRLDIHEIESMSPHNRMVTVRKRHGHGRVVSVVFFGVKNNDRDSPLPLY